MTERIEDRRLQAFSAGRPWAVATAACLLVVLDGCGADQQEDLRVRPQTVELAAEHVAEVQWEGDRAVSLETKQGARVEFIDGEAAIGDQLVIQALSGDLVVYRVPNGITGEMDTLPHLYLTEGTLEQIVTNGFQGEPYINPADRTLCWTARTCTHPDCSSRTAATSAAPKLFINRMPGVSVTADGRLTSVNAMPASLNQACPFCGRRDGVEQFVLPETARRQAELAEELRQVRDARDRR